MPALCQACVFWRWREQDPGCTLRKLEVWKGRQTCVGTMKVAWQVLGGQGDIQLLQVQRERDEGPGERFPNVIFVEDL